MIRLSNAPAAAVGRWVNPKFAEANLTAAQPATQLAGRIAILSPTSVVVGQPTGPTGGPISRHLHETVACMTDPGRSHPQRDLGNDRPPAIGRREWLVASGTLVLAS